MTSLDTLTARQSADPAPRTHRVEFFAGKNGKTTSASLTWSGL